MIGALLLSMSFFVTTVFAATFIPSLPYPFAYTPLIMITGLLTMHRVGVGPGVAWLVLGGLTMQMQHAENGWGVATILSSGVALLLVERVFATRSVYALLGVGLVTGLFALVIFTIITVISSITSGNPIFFTDILLQDIWTLLLLLTGLYGGFLIVATLRNWTRHLFVVR